jgi:hypothetical protein
MEHTKGPWEVGDWFYDESSQKCFEILSNKKVIASAIVNTDEGEAKANAVLMATSPAMREFIRQEADGGNKNAQEFLKTLGLCTDIVLPKTCRECGRGITIHRDFGKGQGSYKDCMIKDREVPLSQDACEEFIPSK